MLLHSESLSSILGRYISRNISSTRGKPCLSISHKMCISMFCCTQHTLPFDCKCDFCLSGSDDGTCNRNRSCNLCKLIFHVFRAVTNFIKGVLRLIAIFPSKLPFASYFFIMHAIDEWNSLLRNDRQRSAHRLLGRTVETINQPRKG
jgi:hypothetical protein